MRKLLLLVLMIGLLSCGSRETLAPVVESNWHPFNPNSTKHIVKKGETLYSISFYYDTDYQELARINNLHSPYVLSVGQVINLKGSRASRTHSPVAKDPQIKPYYTVSKNTKWRWPTKGKIVENFFPKFGKKGINIAGKKGQNIYASNNGIIAYSGRGLENYGNLIIIKHENNYLTAYGNNLRNLVSEGDYVKSGQVIAQMGIVNQKYYGLHFEIRKKGQPVNPLSYLNKP